MKLVLATLSLAALLTACSERRPISFYNNTDTTDEVEDTDLNDTLDSEDELAPNNQPVAQQVEVPFTEQGGVKTVEVKINDAFTVDMIIDSGCSGLLISSNEANYLYNKGVLTQDDILGVTTSQIADGSIMENMVVNLHQIVIGGRIACKNVQATVVDNPNVSLLLGNGVLDRVASYTIDNANQVIRFNINAEE